MNYRLKSKPQRKNKKIIIVVIILVVILYLVSIFLTSVVRSASIASATPSWKGGRYVATSILFISDFFNSKSDLMNENYLLKEKVKELYLKQLDHEVVVSENRELKELLGRPYIENKVIARILSKPPRSPYDTFVIDVGTSQGISKDNLVFTSGNLVIGKVSDSLKNNSIITLFSTSGQKQEATLERTGSTFELSGRGGGNFSIELPKDTDVVWGDVFIYPDINSSIIGNVYFIDEDSQSAFKTVFIKAPVNVFESKWLFVEKINER